MRCTLTLPLWSPITFTRSRTRTGPCMGDVMRQTHATPNALARLHRYVTPLPSLSTVFLAALRLRAWGNIAPYAPYAPWRPTALTGTFYTFAR